MRITINPTLDMETLQWVSNDGVYEYFGTLDLFCSSGGSVATDDKALQDAQLAQANALNSDYKLTFAENQNVVQNQMAKANALMSNPMGLSPQSLHASTTAINENTARATSQAIGAAAARGAQTGSSDIAGGGTAQLVAQIESAGAQSKSAQLSDLQQRNEAAKRESFMAGLSELNNAGSNLQGQTGNAGSSSVADSSVNAGKGALAAQEQGWQNTMGLISGI